MKPFEFLFLLIFITLYNAICDWFYIISCHSNKTSYFPFTVMFLWLTSSEATWLIKWYITVKILLSHSKNHSLIYISQKLILICFFQYTRDLSNIYCYLCLWIYQTRYFFFHIIVTSIWHFRTSNCISPKLKPIHSVCMIIYILTSYKSANRY